MVLIAAGGFFGNLPDILRYRDWPPSELRGLFFTVSLFAACGSIFLIVAYGLFRKRNWGVPLALVFSALAVLVLVAGGLQEGYDPAGVGFLLAFYGIPFLFTSIWSFTQLTRQKKLGTSGTRGDQLA